MKLFIKNIIKYFNYAVESAKAELKSEIAGSFLNWLWWIIEPMCFMLIYTFVFTIIFKNSQQYFSVFVFIGLSCWEFFNRMINGSVSLISNNRDLVSKIYVPKYILLFSKSLTYLFKLIIAIMVTITLMIFLNVPFSIKILWIFFIIPMLYLLSFGIGCFLMHYGVFIDDLKKLVSIVLRLVFYLSGVFYNINTRLTGMVKYLLLRGNPVAFSMHEMRKVMIYLKTPSFEGVFIWYFISIVICILGIRLIIKNENNYAKVI